MTRQEIIDAAVEAACERVFEIGYGGRYGKWPEGADLLPGTSARQWRAEELDALLPALKVLEEAGVLTWPPE